MSWADGARERRFLPVLPAELLEHAQFTDRLPPERIPQWLADFIQRRVPILGAQIKQSVPDWKRQLEQALAPDTGLATRLTRHRLKQAQNVLESGSRCAAEIHDVLQRLPDYKTRLEIVVRARTGELEDQLRVQIKEGLQRELIEERSRLEKVQEQIRQATETLKRLRDEQQPLLNLTNRLEDLSQRLIGERNAIVGDVLVVQELLRGPHPTTNGVAHSAPSFPSSSEQTEPSVAPEITPPVTEGSPLEPKGEWVGKRLLPCLARWVPSARDTHARLLHAAVLGCRWSLVPDTGWAVAYSEALGGSGELLIQAADPAWLRFRDVWGGEVGEFWRRATIDPHRVYILVFQEINRSLPQCWSRVWLDLLAGYRLTFPTSEIGPMGWPVNLRVLATLATEEPIYPLAASAYRLWGGVPPPSTRDSARPPMLHAGHVRAADWVEFVGNQPERQAGEWPTFTDFDGLSLPAARDIDHLTRILIQLGRSQRDAADDARTLRIDAPSEYAGGS